MANKRKSMRKIRQVLRLAGEAGLVQRQIARSLSMSPTTVGEYLRRAEGAGLGWPLPSGLDDTELEALLFPATPPRQADTRPLPQVIGRVVGDACTARRGVGRDDDQAMLGRRAIGPGLGGEIVLGAGQA